MSSGPEATPPRPRPPKAGGGLTKKVGPLPVWAWGAILVGGIGFILYVRSRSKGQTADVNTPATGTIFDQGGGPPSSPANGVTDGSNPCPAGYDYIGGACVPSATPPPAQGPDLYGPPTSAPVTIPFVPTGSFPFITTTPAPTAGPLKIATVAPGANLAVVRNQLKLAGSSKGLKTAKPAGK